MLKSYRSTKHTAKKKGRYHIDMIYKTISNEMLSVRWCKMREKAYIRQYRSKLNTIL